MEKLKLSNVTLVCVDCINYGNAVSAIKKSQHQVDFEKTLFFTDTKIYSPKLPFEVIKIDRINSKAEYSVFIMKELHKYINTDYVLIIQHDSWILNSDCWDDDFLNYDYVGAAWLESDGYNVGNGGFSARSKKLLTALGTDDFIKPYHPEDATICRMYRPYLEDKYGIKFAPDQVADAFSFELREPIQRTFGFHGMFHVEHKPVVVIKRTSAMGDCVAIEPLLDYYNKKGYKVVIDMPLEFAILFQNHHFKVYHISQLDNRIPRLFIDLDGSYENNPKQLHLKSYYEAAGIPDGEIKNPKLNFIIGDHNRLFKKYAVIHADQRAQPYRNIYGVEWREIVQYLNKKGLTVIQVGLAEHEEIEGAVYMKTPVANFLQWLIAGAECFLGADSGPAAIAVASGIPSVIFFGSVDPQYIHPDLSNICVIQKEKPCSTPKCWHSIIGGTTGMTCVENATKPPCTQFNMDEVMYSIDKFLSR